MVEHGLKESAAYSPAKLVSPTLKNVRLNSVTEDFLEVQYSSNFLEKCQGGAPEVTEVMPEVTTEVTPVHGEHSSHHAVDQSTEKADPDLLASVKVRNGELAEVTLKTPEHTPDEDGSNMEELLDTDEDHCMFPDDKLSLQITTSVDSSPCHGTEKLPTEENATKDAVNTEAEKNSTESNSNVATATKRLSRSDSRQSNTSQGSLSSVASDLSQVSVKAMSGIKTKISNIWPGKDDGPKIELKDMRSPSPTTLVADALGFPLPLFTKGVLCHPYLSLQYYDLLRDPNVRGFVVGASNMLFKQKRNLLDVIVEVLKFFCFVFLL